ncbi:MAG: hypothetical protein E6R13_00630 [Spirochaetes bacterium]|nr:MAG: hypothetical protein E6R13_00630 [Spirochaetota bacterium]
MNDGYSKLIDLLPSLENETLLKCLNNNIGLYLYLSGSEYLYYIDFKNKVFSPAFLRIEDIYSPIWAKINKYSKTDPIAFSDLKDKLIPKQIIKKISNDSFYYVYIDNQDTLFELSVSDYTVGFKQYKFKTHDLLDKLWVIIG